LLFFWDVFIKNKITTGGEQQVGSNMNGSSNTSERKAGKKKTKHN
jgi:hypothetical protein